MKIAPLIGRGDYEGAIRILEGELTGTADDALYLEMIAHWHWIAGNHEKAIETAKKALSLDPTSFDMPRILSQIYAKREEHEQAAAYVKIGLNNYPAENLQAPPAWAFGVLKFVGKFSARWKRIEEAANEDLKDPDKDRREWNAWAKQYVAWYEASVRK